MAAKYHQKTKKCYKEMHAKTIKIFLQKENTKSKGILVIYTETFL